MHQMVASSLSANISPRLPQRRARQARSTTSTSWTASTIRSLVSRHTDDIRILDLDIASAATTIEYDLKPWPFVPNESIAEEVAFKIICALRRGQNIPGRPQVHRAGPLQERHRPQVQIAQRRNPHQRAAEPTASSAQEMTIAISIGAVYHPSTSPIRYREARASIMIERGLARQFTFDYYYPNCIDRSG